MLAAQTQIIKNHGSAVSATTEERALKTSFLVNKVQDKAFHLDRNTAAQTITMVVHKQTVHFQI